MLLPTRLRLPRLGRPTPRLARRLTNRGVVDLRVPGNADTAEAASRCPPPWIQLEKCGHASASAHRYRAALPVVHYPRNERNNSEIEGSGVRSLQQNQRVQFEIARGAKGPQAVGVNRRDSKLKINGAAAVWPVRQIDDGSHGAICRGQWGYPVRIVGSSSAAPSVAVCDSTNSRRERHRWRRSLPILQAWPDLALCERDRARGAVDGAWWPKSPDLGSELPDLVAVFRVAVRTAAGYWPQRNDLR